MRSADVSGERRRRASVIVRGFAGHLHVEERRFGGTRVVVELHQPADIEGAE
ncbi:hypothetical protein LC1Hm_1126 [Halomicrobium sp. LC1Hm]|nr:hypothetical protein LC1Hm_1126 [Halomicrobium sp. LC1Hm]